MHLSTNKTIYINLPSSTGICKTDHDSFSSITNTLYALLERLGFSQCLNGNINTNSSSYFLYKIFWKLIQTQK